VVLLLNQEGYISEDWHDYAANVAEAIGRLKEAGLIPAMPELPGENGKFGYPVAASPAAVFGRLVRLLCDRAEQESVVIDVTGAKKSMVTGAYLYAAYAGCRISYVDFDGDAYDQRHRRPYGYRCKIGELSNPYQLYALRQWELVRKKYEDYQFREARRVLETEIRPVMTEYLKEETEYLKESENALNLLAQFLEYYDQWDRGDYRQARETGEEIKRRMAGITFEQPHAVVELGAMWFQTGPDVGVFNGAPEPKDLYGDIRKLVVYILDELSRVERLIQHNEDYRSAFVRAAALNEVIMLGRLVAAVADGHERERLLNALKDKTPSASALFKALQKSSFTIGKRGKTCIGWEEGPEPPIQVTGHQPMDPWWQKSPFPGLTDASGQTQPGWDRFLYVRNKLTHTYLSVPKEWAEKALEFVRLNFEEWIGHLGPQAPDCQQFVTRALEWPRLIELIGLSRLLPPSLRR